MTVEDLLERICEAHDDADTDRAAELLPAADKAALEALSAALDSPLPAELVAVWSVFGGQEYFSPGVEGLFVQHRLLSPTEALSEYRTLMEVRGHSFSVRDRLEEDGVEPQPLPKYPPDGGRGGWWVPQLLPFAGWDAYLLCIDLVGGQVWDFEPHAGLLRQWPSIRALLERVLEVAPTGEDADLAP